MRNRNGKGIGPFARRDWRGHERFEQKRAVQRSEDDYRHRQQHQPHMSSIEEPHDLEFVQAQYRSLEATGTSPMMRGREDRRLEPGIAERPLSDSGRRKLFRQQNF